MESLIKLQWLDLRGNKITDLEEINYLSEMKSLQCLFFQGQDGNHQNPICNKENYSSFTQKLLPQLAFLDGINSLLYTIQSFYHVKINYKTLNIGHSLMIVDQINYIEESWATIKPSPDSFIDLPAENWFSTEDLKDFNNEDANHKTDDMIELEESQSKLVSILTADCAHLVRKSNTVLQKANIK